MTPPLLAPYAPAMDIPLSVKGFTFMQGGAGLVAVAAPSVLARFSGLSPARFGAAT